MLQAILTIIVSGVLYYFSTGFHFLWPLMWFAPIPVLVYAYRANIWRSLIVSFIVGLVPGINIIVGYSVTLMPLTALFMGTLSQAIVWMLVVILTRYFTHRINNGFSLFSYPTLIALVDYLQSLGTHGTYSSIAYTQIDNLPILQIASVTGLFGISFVVSLFAAVAAYVLYQRDQQRCSAVMIALAIIIATLAYGWVRVLEIPKANTPMVTVGLVVVNPPENGIYDERSPALIIHSYAPLISQLAKAGAEVIVMPEKAFSVANPINRAVILHQMSRLAAQNQVMLITGVYQKLGEQKSNVAWVFANNGIFLGEYAKHHLVPGAEVGVMPGNSTLHFAVNNLLAGVAICRDMDFIDPAYQYGLAQVGILFVPAHDVSVDGKLHSVGAVMRGVENGYAVVRASKFGLLTVNAPTGELLAEARAVNPNQATLLLAKVPVGTVNTLFDRYGNWFAVVLGLLLLSLVCRSWLNRQASKNRLE
jgi:apolipoprotein N-acyltransferase